MKRLVGLAAVLISLLILTTACSSNDDNSCGVGESLSHSGKSYCVYKQAIIEDGFLCPLLLPHKFERNGYVICGGEESIPEDLNPGELPSKECDKKADFVCCAGDVEKQAVCTDGAWSCPADTIPSKNGADPWCQLPKVVDPKTTTLITEELVSSFSNVQGKQPLTVQHLFDINTFADFNANGPFACARVKLDQALIVTALEANFYEWIGVRVEMAPQGQNPNVELALTGEARPTSGKIHQAGDLLPLVESPGGLAQFQSYLIEKTPLNLSVIFEAQAPITSVTVTLKLQITFYKNLADCTEQSALTVVQAQTLACDQVESEYKKLAEDLTGKTCQTDQDCVLVGGSKSCNCNTVLGSSSGNGFNKTAAPVAQALQTRFFSDACKGAIASGVCDATPPTGARCVNKFCVAVGSASCLGGP